MDSVLPLGLCLFISFENVGIHVCKKHQHAFQKKALCLFPLQCVPNEVIGELCSFLCFHAGQPMHGVNPYTYALDAIWSITQNGHSGSSHLPLPCIAIRQARKLNAVIRGCGCCMRVGTRLTRRSVWRNKMETFPQHYWTTLWSWMPCYMMSFCLIWWCCFTKNSFSHVLLAVWW